MHERIPHPPFDPELSTTLAQVAGMFPTTVTADMIQDLRDNPLSPSLDDVLDGHDISYRHLSIPGHLGDDIEVTVLERRGRSGRSPAFVHFHGGGMVLGDRFVGIGSVLPWASRHDAVVIAVEYRLAPEFPDPYPVEDCYAALRWTAANAEELGIDLDRLLVVGASAGGGLAAGTALMARDRGGPRLAGQVLTYPMLDDRDGTVSTAQIDGVGTWDRGSNLTEWTALLGDRRSGADVSIYAAPARASDLSGLPPAIINCGSTEVFRDEDVAYATALWQAGVQAELHVWPGGFHGFDVFAPQSELARAMVAARDAWVARALGAAGPDHARPAPR